MKRIAIIPARGGSKRLPRKNVIEFFGRPLIAWTIVAARESGVFERVLVSTEDADIAEISREHGAEVPFLRERYFDDMADVSQATLAALSQAVSHFRENYDVVTQLMANCPLRTAADIRTAEAAFDTAAVDFQISCVRCGWLNPWWAMTLDRQGRGTPMFPEKLASRSQDLPPLYVPTGAIWIARVAALRAAGTFYGPGHRFQPLSILSGVDIDDEEDLSFARAAYLQRQQGAAAV